MILDGIEVSVVRKPVKYVRISVLSDCSVKIVAPEGFEAEKVFYEKKNWILKKIKQKTEIFNQNQENSGMMLFFGSYFTLFSGNSCCFDYENMTVEYPSVREFKKYVRKKLAEDLDKKTADVSARMEVKYSGFGIRRQKSRWASCSSSGSLNFNLRIAALPDYLREYIVVHELAHIIEHNHSKAFWRVVEMFCPEYRKYRKELSGYWFLIENNRIWRILLE
ncbi:putative metal-dependent hydrolase [Methanomicrobium sp. W14]|uniref:M48 family metallopeptidase n=1 Tax=Methanomicrobium sp. W14 TaxID=2817839 RepID=UPI001AE68F95|nr:SprT family zinc-dependent metalloprotease [Methanomicrobium sp. W14]MBP2133779.1 putative metal-dependent hydrolase [Methanomicrobium sp. W14]